MGLNSLYVLEDRNKELEDLIAAKQAEAELLGKKANAATVAYDDAKEKFDSTMADFEHDMAIYMDAMAKLGAAIDRMGVRGREYRAMGMLCLAAAAVLMGTAWWSSPPTEAPAPGKPNYPRNADDWEAPDGWKETPAGERSGGKNRQWVDEEDKTRRRWDRSGRKGGKERGEHWHDFDDETGGKRHIDPDD